MNWVVFSYSLPSRSRSSPRVALWRRLRRLGAISLPGGVYLLPARDECVEAFEWLAQEIRQAEGEAMVMHVEQFEGLTNQHLIELFREARKKEYEGIDDQVAELEKAVTNMKSKDRSRLRETLGKLRRRYTDITRIDYFDSPERNHVASRFARIEQALSPHISPAVSVIPATVATYQNKRWVTRPRPHVDRLACAWLIRRFIDPNAVIRYSLQPESNEIAFDMSDGQFGHQGSFCTFETMIRAFELDEPALRAIAEIVHEIDLRDGRYVRPEVTGIDVILKGWLLIGLPDTEIESRGVALFEGFYAALSYGSSDLLQGEKARKSKSRRQS